MAEKDERLADALVAFAQLLCDGPPVTIGAGQTNRPVARALSEVCRTQRIDPRLILARWALFAKEDQWWQRS